MLCITVTIYSTHDFLKIIILGKEQHHVFAARSLNTVLDVDSSFVGWYTGYQSIIQRGKNGLYISCGLRGHLHIIFLYPLRSSARTIPPPIIS